LGVCNDSGRLKYQKYHLGDNFTSLTRTLTWYG
jgi:hypothetical protein